MIEKAGGLKAGEDKWLGLSDWLKEQSDAKHSPTKQEVLDFIRENSVQIEEVEYEDEPLPDLVERCQRKYTEYYNEATDNGIEEPELYAMDKMKEEYGSQFEDGFYTNGNKLVPSFDPESDYGQWLMKQEGVRPINSTRLNYTTEGLDNKREIAFVVPTAERYEDDEIHFGELGGQAIMWVRFGETTDADGKRVLVIDEIQSKRHQEGREKGYLNKGVIEEYNHRGDILTKWRKHFIDKYDIEPWRSDEDIIKRLDEYEKEDYEHYMCGEEITDLYMNY
jgi:hypothetical protein